MLRPAPTTHECHGEVTGKRPSGLSRWHRDALPWWAFCCDLDLVEVRDGQIVAVAEHGEVEGKVTDVRVRAIARCKPLQLSVVRQIARALNVGGFFILNSADLTAFGVLDLADDSVRILDGAAFARFLKEL